jgi:hypothetical protein
MEASATTSCADGFVPGARCRVDADYSISVEMRGRVPFLLRVPGESDVFHRAAGILELNSYDADLRPIRRPPKFQRMGKWDKGRYLDGILELFGGLQWASRLFEHNYWRSVFERLSLGVPEKEEGLFERVKNQLDKKKGFIRSHLAGEPPPAIEWLSHLVIRSARELQLRQEEISFTDLDLWFHEQRERFILSNPNFRTATTPEDIQEERKAATSSLAGVLQNLTDSGVLQQGVRVRCTNCGSRLWREMGNIRQKITCDGCGAVVSVPVESVWHYRLNSLVRNGIALHGCVPVVLALRALCERAKDSFIYTHGVGLFKSYEDSKPEAELDLLCISNGKLICGEVKSAASEFTLEELKKLARVAADIRADEAAIFALNDPKGLMEKNFQTLSALLHTGCTATVYAPSSWTFQPQPHPF